MSTLTSITYTETSTVPLATDYRFHKPTGTLTHKYEDWFAGGDIIEVVFTAGYEATPTPIVSIIYSLLEERYNKKVNGVDLNFGSDIQRISIPGAISVDFDYTLQANERKVAYGMILGNYVNVLDQYRSERPLVGATRLEYVD